MKDKKGILHYVAQYKFKSLLIRNFFLIFLAIITAIGGMGMIVYRSMKEAMEAEIKIISQNSLESMGNVVDTIIRDVNIMATRIAVNANTTMFMTRDLYGELLLNFNRDIVKEINSFYMVHSYLDSIYVYSEKSDFVISSREGGELERFADQQWYPSYLNIQKDEAWIEARKKNNYYPYFISVGKPIFMDSSSKLGAVIVNINAEGLDEMIGKGRGKTEENVWILDADGTILYNNKDKEIMGQSIKDLELFSQWEIQEGSDSSIVNIGQERFVLSSVNSKHNQWKYISLLPLEHYLKNTERIKNFLFIFFIVGASFTLILSMVLSIRTFGPVKRILSLMESPNEIRNSQNNEDNNELKYIAGRIMQTIYSNEQLQKELETRMGSLVKAQTVALQSQMNPHFLHNTLDTINFSAARLLGTKNDLSKMISALSKLLRFSLSIDDKLIPIATEIQYAKYYVDIMMVRYKQKCQVIWEIPEEILPYKIIRLCIQPLIENSFYHGFKADTPDGKIRIWGVQREDQLDIIVSDNGVGMTAEEIRQWNMLLREEYELEGEHIGIKNVNQRIQLVFGQVYGIHFEGNQEGGLHAIIRMPKI